ncbi:MAG: glycosyltransferase family 39 protein [Candidatus Heimdallarchaeota archaeon]
MLDGDLPTETQFSIHDRKEKNERKTTRKNFSEFVSTTFFKKIFNYLPLTIIVIISIILRLFAAQESQGFVHPDEVFQALEMIHYWIDGEYGSGNTIPWEYNTNYQFGGARSWFFVLLLVGVYKFVMLFGITDPMALIYSARLFLSLFSIITVVVAYLFGKEMFNKTVGLVSAFICGTWWFFPFWASRTMTDSLSSDFLFLSIFLIYKAIRHEKVKRKITLSAIAGLLLGLSFMIRFPGALMGIPLAIAILYKPLVDIFRKIASSFRTVFKMKEKPFDSLSKKEYYHSFLTLASFCGGAFLMVLFQGLLDLFTWGSFLHSPINYFQYNIVEGNSAYHGVAPWYQYFAGFFTDFAYFFIFIFFILFIIGLVYKEKNKSKVFVLILMFYWLAIFSSIAHKEFRFIMTFLPLGMLFVANGIYQISKLVERKRFQYAVLGLLLAILSTSSLYMGLVEKNYMWKGNSGICNAMYWVGQQEDSERIIVLEMVWYTGGYAYLDKNISITFVRAQSANPLWWLNSTDAIEKYYLKGTYIVIRENDLNRVSLFYFDIHEFFLHHGFDVVANIAGGPNAFVYKNQL